MKSRKSQSLLSTRVLIGPRAERYRASEDIFAEVARAEENLLSRRAAAWGSLHEIRSSYAPHCRAYYTLAALSRRKVLEEKDRRTSLSCLFRLRTLIERTILRDLAESEKSMEVLAIASEEAFFGSSAKQGVSIRYPLASCIPTDNCGGRCYAHDGRDREIHHIFRGVLNMYLGRIYEDGGDGVRADVMRRLARTISKAVFAAQEDKRRALAEGYSREPRIRFAHIGEMVDTPEFSNALALEIKRRDPSIRCVLYTRHPKVSGVDTRLFVVNFTLEGRGDRRKEYAPKDALIVSSAWDGVVMPEATVNFLEHHVEKIADASRSGSICPVTASHHAVVSCDEACCDRCFRPKGPKHRATGIGKPSRNQGDKGTDREDIVFT
jgi:hypothetical protein